MDTLLNLEPARSMGNIKAVRKVVDSVETHVGGVKALGIDSKQYGTLFVPILMDKLPEGIRLIISRKYKDNFDLNLSRQVDHFITLAYITPVELKVKFSRDYALVN